MAERLRRERRRFIQLLLRGSLLVSAALMMIGLVMRITSGRTSSPTVTPGQLFAQIDTGTRFMLAGIVLLAVSPALRVVALLLLWIRERAWRFVATSALVLILLAVALWAGGG